MKAEVLITVTETDEACALELESMYRSGVRPCIAHRTSSASADAVVRYLRARPDAVPVRRSPDDETVADFQRAIKRARDMVHVYYEQVCDVCGALPPLFHTSVRAGFFCRPCAEAIIDGDDTKTAGRS